jgi:hypothetical protein
MSRYDNWYEEADFAEPDWELLERRADMKIDEKKDACAHLDKDVWDVVRYLPLEVAKHEGEILQAQNRMTRAIAERLMPAIFDA